MKQHMLAVFGVSCGVALLPPSGVAWADDTIDIGSAVVDPFPVEDAAEPAAAVALATPVGPYDNLLPAIPFANYIMSPTGNYDSYPGYLTSADDLYLKPMGDTAPVSAALGILPTNSYGYGTTVPQGAQEIAAQVDKDYLAGDLSASHPDVLFSYSDSSVMYSEAESIMYNTDHIPTQDVIGVIVGDTANPQTGYFINPANNFWLALGGDSNLEGVKTPENFYQNDIFTLQGNWLDGSDYYADNTGVDPSQTVHESYMGLNLFGESAPGLATIPATMTEHTVDTLNSVGGEVATNFFTIDTPSNTLGLLYDAASNIFGW